MKKILVALVALLFCGNVFSQGIVFEHGTFTEALAKAKQKNKMVFMDCYTKWCGPCKYLAKNIFTQEELSVFFNKNFVNVKMDMESVEGKKLGEKYQVKSFPTLLWLNAEGYVQHKTMGASDVKSLIKTATLALDSKNNWRAVENLYLEGDRSLELLRKYILMGIRVGVDTQDAADQYFFNRKPEEMINAEDVEIISNTVSSSSHPIFSFVLKNKAKFYAIADKAKVDQFLEYTMIRELFQLVRKGNQEELSFKKKELIGLDPKLGAKVIAFMEMNMLRNSGESLKYHQAVIDYAFKYMMDNSEVLNQYAWSIAEAKEGVSKKMLTKAVEMASRSVELDANFANTDTYAYILNKVGRVKEAKVEAEKSVNLASAEEKKDLWSAKFLNSEVK